MRESRPRRFARNVSSIRAGASGAAAYGGGTNISGNAALGSNAADARAFGVVGGVDYRISPATLAGFALAGGGTNFSVSGFGSGRSDLFQAGAFIRHTIGAAYVTGALVYGGQEITTDRIVTVAGFDRLRAQFDANAWSGRVEGGYRYLTPWMGITPYAAGQFTTFSLPAYTEQVLAGVGNFALNYTAKDVTASRSELGVRTDRSFAMQNGILTLRGRLAWAHDFNTDRTIAAVFQTLPGASFVVNGAAQAHDFALTTASAEMKWLNDWSAAAIFEGEFSPVTNSYAGKGVVRYAGSFLRFVGKITSGGHHARGHFPERRDRRRHHAGAEAGAGQVLVKTLACGICGSDLHARKHAHRMVELTRHFPGRKPMDLSRDVVFGHEFCCEVLDYGPATTAQAEARHAASARCRRW